MVFDFVSSPSTPGAYLFKESKSWGLTRLNGNSSKILKTNDLDNFNPSMSDLLKMSNKEFWKK